MKHSILGAACAGILIAASDAAQASLIDRGGGLIYDDVLDVTWLRDTNYARSSGYDSDGRMTWQQAIDWAESLSYYDGVRDKIYTDWRLPTVNPVSGAGFNYSFSYNGSTDVGFYNASTASELGYMYYVNLGNPGYYTTNGALSGCYVSFPSDTCLENTGPFINLVGPNFWSGTESTVQSYSAFFSNFVTGDQSTAQKTNLFYAWAVRDGDVAAVSSVPLPAAAWLLGSGLWGLVGLSAKRRH